MRTEIIILIFSFGKDLLLELFKWLLERWNTKRGSGRVPELAKI